MLESRPTCIAVVLPFIVSSAVSLDLLDLSSDIRILPALQSIGLRRCDLWNIADSRWRKLEIMEVGLDLYDIGASGNGYGKLFALLHGDISMSLA